MINIKFDDARVQDADIVLLSNNVQKIVSKITGVKDTFVYADSPKIKIAVAPIEIFVEMGVKEFETRDRHSLMKEIKIELAEWKKESNFSSPINLSIVVMDWIFEIGI